MPELIFYLAMICQSYMCAEIQTPDGQPLAVCLNGYLQEYISIPCDPGLAIVLDIKERK